MPIRLSTLRKYRWLASLLVVAFAMRALIPIGYMPGGDGRFGLQVCPEGFPAALLPATHDHAAHAHHHHHPGADPPGDSDHSGGAPAHDHKSWMAGHCAFSAVACAPPVSLAALIGLVSISEASPIQAAATPIPRTVRFRIAQPRAPPYLA